MADGSSHTDDTPVARTVRYSGAVQGVGFRVTALHIARQHPVTGYVKNLPDGGVELHAEGAPRAVSDFLEAVRTYWKHHIYKEQSEDETPSGRYRCFEIAH